MLVFEFDAALAAMDAEGFVADVLAARIGAAGVVTGDDFSFGKGRGGDVALLQSAWRRARHRRRSRQPGPRRWRPRSSGRVREALVAGDPATATRMLSRPYAIEGIVQPGDKRGRELGYPTANLQLGDYQRPRYGIYAVRVTLDDGSEHPGVASLGVRPTFQPPQELLEAHIFDFDGDLYGRSIEVALHAFIRDERKFDSVDALDRADARGRSPGATDSPSPSRLQSCTTDR